MQDFARRRAVSNAAAYTAVDRAESEPDVRRVNAEAVGYLAEAANKVGALLVQVSTDYVFDGRNHQTVSRADPQTLKHGASKLAGEQYATGAKPLCYCSRSLAVQ